MNQQQMGGRPPRRRSELCLPLLILLLLFIWPVGLAYLVYKLAIDQGENNAVNEFVWWAESLFGGGKARNRPGGQAGAPRQPAQGVPPQQQSPYQQARPQGTPQQPPYQQVRPQGAPQQPPYQQARPQGAPQQPPYQQARPQGAPQQPPYQQVRPQGMPQQPPYQQVRPQGMPQQPPYQQPYQQAPPQGAAQQHPNQPQASQRPPQQPRQSQTQQTSAAVSSPKNKEKSKKQNAGTMKNRKISIALRIIGVLLLLTGIPQLAEEVSWLLSGYDPIWDLLLSALSCTAAGVLLFFVGQRQAILARRAAKYLRAMGKSDAIELDELAKRVGRSRHKVIRELEKLIDKEYLNDVYLDLEMGYFLRYDAKVNKPEKEEAPKAEKPPVQGDSRYEKIIGDIRAANDRIDDEELSAKIDRLEQITAQILKEVSAHPEKVEKMHTFFDYYLPTTQKLLDTYADFEETGVEGENLREAKQRIESTMDSIVDGFVRQLDNLYKSDVMDVESDIRVMESMLRRDSASAARDFGGQQVQEK